MRTGTPHGRRWPVRWTLLAACLLSVFVGCTSTLLVSTHAAVHDSSKVLLSANRVECLVVDLETGQLGFVATGDARSLHPWIAARAAFPGEAARLQRLADERAQGARAREIIRAADAYLREHAVPLVTAAQRDRGAARSLIARGEGRRRIDAIWSQLDRFAEAQHQISSANERDAVPATRRMLAAATGTSGSALVVLLLAGLLVRTAVHRTAVHRSPPRRCPAGPRTGEQEALRWAATHVALGGPPEEVLGAVAAEAGRLLGGDRVTVERYEPDGTAVLAHWTPREAMPPPGHWAVEYGTAKTPVPHTRRTASAPDAAGEIVSHEARQVVARPIVASGRPWGVMSLMSRTPGSPGEEIGRSLDGFAELAGIAVANAEERAELAASLPRTPRRRRRRGPARYRARPARPYAAAPGSDRTEPAGRGGLRAARPGGPAGEARLRLARTVHHVVYEALTNAARHAHASDVRVTVETGSALTRIQVTDDGIGGADPARGSGLSRLRDRVEALGGTLRVDSPPGGGTTLRVTIPA